MFHKFKQKFHNTFYAKNVKLDDETDVTVILQHRTTNGIPYTTTYISPSQIGTGSDLIPP